MASSVVLHNLCFASLSIPKRYYPQTLTLTHSQFLSSKSFLKLKRRTSLSHQMVRQSRSIATVLAAQSNFLKVVQTAWEVGKNGIEAGTNLVPDSVPRPVARISVTVVALSLSLFVLKSFLSTAFFVLATMGLVYFTFIALNKDKGPKGDGGPTSTDDALEEAKRIMDKYK
ncbi:hypothetical protein HS088_TW17G00145 [Tripterygium wilfordii]|uniref:Transmembrane protein n=1 Tax=Tripterygium wilfordii TaxID=458696 RepID=A0A7J7CF95_TRIWF|nr:uncharacterized protein LOC119982198 [Tripterygium wilfordii]KAF5732615.1 hypothetical protein HS088_TW17G00145 [Tripterygium wilfordii]